MRYLKYLLVSTTLIAKVFTMEAPESQGPLCFIESPVLSPLEEMPLEVLEQVLSYLSPKDLLSSVLACKRLATAAENLMKKLRENILSWLKQGLKGIHWEPGNERQQIISHYSINLSKGLSSFYHSRLTRSLAALELTHLYFINKNANNLFKEEDTINTRLKLIEILASLRPEQIYILSKHALKIFTVQSPESAYLLHPYMSAGMQSRLLTGSERAEIIELLAPFATDKLDYICKRADKILRNFSKAPFSKTPFEVFKESLPVFQVFTLHHLNSFLEDVPNLKGNLLSLEKIAKALSSLSRERLVFVSNNMDKLVGSDLSFLVQGFHLIIER
ncbi:F-box protein [Candidatus Odyssella thessalonicensis]|uniref:F-box protein n=1 Tax=Candidatus Odyssella thessalonicensis TaxID=84647 RepID=UPI000225B725|nr:F-box protein [Candidatus Odyssella thessalonicensis]